MVDRVAGTLAVSIPAFVPINMIAAPGGATHFKIVSAGAEIDKPIAAAPQPDNTGTSAEPLRVEETIQAAKLVSQPKLKTPREARRASIEGVVKLEALIGADGRVKTSTVLSGPDELQAAAIENLGKRKYEPTFVDGKPVEVLTEVSLEFNGKD